MCCVGMADKLGMSIGLREPVTYLMGTDGGVQNDL